jgi:hypothetical protein
MGCQLDVGKYRGACPRGMNHILRSILPASMPFETHNLTADLLLYRQVRRRIFWVTGFPQSASANRLCILGDGT